MNLIFTLSLEQRALANIAITLWSQNDVRDLMSKSDLYMLSDNWQEIEKVVIQKSFKLRLPEKLKEKLLRFIMRVGLQLLSWVDVNHCNDSYVLKLPATSVWTSLGIINNKKTAKLLVLGGTLDDDSSDEEDNNDFDVKVVSQEVHNLADNVLHLQQYSDVMVFLLSKMNVVQQANVIANYTVALLKCLLVWPWHNLFLEVLEMVKEDKWNSLSKNDYNDVLHFMVALMRYENNIRELFREFWQQSPETYKQYADKFGIVNLLIDLYKRGDEINVKLILKDSSISIRENILKIRGKPIFTYLVSSEKWDSIKLLIQECLSSLEDLIRFRDIFKNHVHMFLSGKEFIKEDYPEEFKEYQWNEFFQLVDGCILKYKKRCTEYNNAPSKKHCIKAMYNNGRKHAC